MTIKKKSTTRSKVKKTIPKQKLKARSTKTVIKKQTDKRKRNVALVETLDAIEKKSAKRKTEEACYVEKDSGKCLFCTSNYKKNSVMPNDEQAKIIRKRGKDLIVTHSHPKPYDSSLTRADFEVVVGNDSAGVRAITKKYTYVAMRPDKGWGIPAYKIAEIYDPIDKKWTDKYERDYQLRKITAKQYADELTHKINQEFCKKVGWKYFRFEN